MDALNAKLAALEKKEAEIYQKRRELDSEEQDIESERMRIEDERLRLSQKLSPHQEMYLKQELTAVGELLELPAVIIGNLRVLSAPLGDSRDIYKISIKTGVTFDSGLTGLAVEVTVKTLCPQVEAIMRSLFIQEGHITDRPESALYWERNWDNGTRIRLTTHEALS